MSLREEEEGRRDINESLFTFTLNRRKGRERKKIATHGEEDQPVKTETKRHKASEDHRRGRRGGGPGRRRVTLSFLI